MLCVCYESDGVKLFLEKLVIRGSSYQKGVPDFMIPLSRTFSFEVFYGILDNHKISTGVDVIIFNKDAINDLREVFSF